MVTHALVCPGKAHARHGRGLQMPGRWPDFLVIGAAKSGTTALDEYLRQHPDLAFPDAREPNFFAFDGTRPSLRDHRGRPAAAARTSVVDPEQYQALFANLRSGSLVGETSPSYLYEPRAAERIARHVPNTRMIVILREPGMRAFSAYQHLVREGREPLDFEAALDAEPARIQDNWGWLWRYVDMGRYATQLERFLTRFPADQILVLLHENLRDDPLATLRRVFEFLGVEPDVVIDTTHRYNVSGVPRRPWLHRLTNPPVAVRRLATSLVPSRSLQRIRRVQADLSSRNLEKLSPPPAALERVRQELSPEVNRLRELTGFDLAGW